jgi:hypothetical protein
VTEPLALELADFARAIEDGIEPLSSKALGLEIVRVLEAADLSMAKGGHPVNLAHPEDPVSGPRVLERWQRNGNGNGTSDHGRPRHEPAEHDLGPVAALQGETSSIG